MTILLCVYFFFLVQHDLGIISVNSSVSLDNIPGTIYPFAYNLSTYLPIKLWGLISYGLS